jgi:hypothetical protein
MSRFLNFNTSHNTTGQIHWVERRNRNGQRQTQLSYFQPRGYSIESSRWQNEAITDTKGINSKRTSLKLSTDLVGL